MCSPYIVFSWSRSRCVSQLVDNPPPSSRHMLLRQRAAAGSRIKALPITVEEESQRWQLATVFISVTGAPNLSSTFSSCHKFFAPRCLSIKVWCVWQWSRKARVLAAVQLRVACNQRESGRSAKQPPPVARPPRSPASSGSPQPSSDKQSSHILTSETKSFSIPAWKVFFPVKPFVN